MNVIDIVDYARNHPLVCLDVFLLVNGVTCSLLLGDNKQTKTKEQNKSTVLYLISVWSWIQKSHRNRGLFLWVWRAPGCVTCVMSTTKSLTHNIKHINK